MNHVILKIACLMGVIAIKQDYATRSMNPTVPATIKMDIVIMDVIMLGVTGMVATVVVVHIILKDHWWFMLKYIQTDLEMSL